jgi:hypothetical protein
LSEILSVLTDYGLNVVIAYLVPTAVAGLILKGQKRRRVYARAAPKELVRDSNLSLAGLNSLFLLWSILNWPGLSIIVLRIATVVFSLGFYFNRPLSVIALPDNLIAIAQWAWSMGDRVLQMLPMYRSLKVRFLATSSTTDTRHHAFSGREINKLADKGQLLLSQTHFICHSCGLEKDNSRLGDILRDENGERLPFCDETSCRMEARNLHTKMFIAWKRKRRVI